MPSREQDIFTTIFPTDKGYLAISVDHPYFRGEGGLHDMSDFEKEDRVNKMKMALGAQGIIVSEIYSLEALIFKFFSLYGMVVDPSRMFASTCFIQVKTIGLKFRVNKLIEGFGRSTSIGVVSQ